MTKLVTNSEISELNYNIEAVLEAAFSGEEVPINGENFKCEFMKSDDGKLNFCLSRDDENSKVWYEFEMSKLITGRKGKSEYDYAPDVPDGIERRLSGR